MLAVVRHYYSTHVKSDMQVYEKLKEHFDQKALYITTYDASLIGYPSKQFKSPETIFGNRASRFIEQPFRVLGAKNYMMGLEKELKSFDIVDIMETYEAYCYQCARAKEKYGFKLVSVVWETIPFFVEDKWIFRNNYRTKIKEKVRENVDLFLAATQRAKEALMIEGIDEEKISIIGPTTEIDRFKPRLKSSKYLEYFGIEPDDVVVLFLSRFIWEKGPLNFIYAAKRVLDDIDGNANVKFLIVGTGKEENRMRYLIDRFNISKNVIMAGYCPYEKLHNIYNLADIFVLLSIPKMDWIEQFGRVSLEAMASGCAVIATSCGPLPEIIGDAGVIVPPNDHYSLYLKLKEVILNDRLRESYKKLARQRAEKFFDVNIAMERMKNEYEKLLKE